MYRILCLPLACFAPLLGSIALAQEADWRDEAVHRAALHHRNTLPAACDPVGSETSASRTYQLQIGEETAARQALLVEFPCRSIDANASSVFVLSDQHGTVSEVLFLSPFIANKDEIDASIPAKDQVRIDWHTTREVLNGQYDESGRTMVAIEKWPGTEAGYSTTKWGYRDGRFQLMRFAVDADPHGRNELEVLLESRLW